MEVFVKSFSTYRTLKKATTISYALVLDSLNDETSSVVVSGLAINRSDVGNWLIIDGLVFNISDVKPQSGRTTITLAAPLTAFSRPLELESEHNEQTVGGFVASQLVAHWAACDDPVFAAPYLVVSSSDTAAYVTPELDSGGCFKLPEYCRLMRKSYRTIVRFADGGDVLRCLISTHQPASRQISFDDGRSRIQSVAYSASGLSKITAIHDVDTGEKDASGGAIYDRQRSTWYLSESGEVSQDVPDRRAAGGWGAVYVKGSDDVRTKVIEEFAKNKTDHKLEFWSTLDLDVQTDCTFMVYGERLSSHISYKRKSSDNKRFYYKSGELATTATEKLKGALK